jgi:hypothetical protein
MPANSTVIAEWWAAFHEIPDKYVRAIASQFREFRQVDHDWDLVVLKSEINEALSVAESPADLVALVDAPGSSKKLKLDQTVINKNREYAFAERRAARSGRCVHNVSGRSCVLCDGKFTSVYISGGGLHWHLEESCTALENGQEKVRLSGGEVSVVERFGSKDPKVFEKSPCRTCLRKFA